MEWTWKILLYFDIMFGKILTATLREWDNTVTNPPNHFFSFSFSFFWRRKKLFISSIGSIDIFQIFFKVARGGPFWGVLCVLWLWLFFLSHKTQTQKLKIAFNLFCGDTCGEIPTVGIWATLTLRLRSHVRTHIWEDQNRIDFSVTKQNFLQKSSVFFFEL